MNIPKLVLILSLSWLSPLQAAQERSDQETLDSLKATDLERGLVVHSILNMAGRAAWGAAAHEVWDAAGRAAGRAVWDAVWDAVGDAVGDAAGRAAGDAAGRAAWDAAWRAAVGAARDAAGNAAGGAARGAARGAAKAARDAARAAGDAAWVAARAAGDAARVAAWVAARDTLAPRIGIAAANAAWEAVLGVEGREVTILRAIRAAPGWNARSFEQAHISDADLRTLLTAHELGDIYTPITHPEARAFVRRSFQNIIMSHPNSRNLAHVCSADFWPRRRGLSEEEYQLQRAGNPGNSAAGRFFNNPLCDRRNLDIVNAMLGN